jgi:hypothetical protein
MIKCKHAPTIAHETTLCVHAHTSLHPKTEVAHTPDDPCTMQRVQHTPLCMVLPQPNGRQRQSARTQFLGRFSGDLVLVPFTVVAPTGVGGRRRVCTAGAGIRGKPPG